MVNVSMAIPSLFGSFATVFHYGIQASNSFHRNARVIPSLPNMRSETSRRAGGSGNGLPKPVPEMPGPAYVVAQCRRLIADLPGQMSDGLAFAAFPVVDGRAIGAEAAALDEAGNRIAIQQKLKIVAAITVGRHDLPPVPPAPRYGNASRSMAVSRRRRDGSARRAAGRKTAPDCG